MFISKCCKAKVKNKGEAICYYICTKCKKPCSHFVSELTFPKKKGNKNERANISRDS